MQKASVTVAALFNDFVTEIVVLLEVPILLIKDLWPPT